MADRVYVDLSEFLASPSRTGIQRVTAELCARWPSGAELVPVRAAEGRLLQLPADCLSLVREYFRIHTGNQSQEEFGNAIRAICNAEVLTPVEPRHPILIPEVFYDPQRLAFYRDLLNQNPHLCYFIAFDFLPLTNGEYFSPNLPHDRISAYFRLLRLARNVAFISDRSRRVYFDRIRRERTTSPGPVLWLGADGLSPTRHSRSQSADPIRPLRFSAVGTIEPRKNHHLMIEAFRLARQRGLDVELVFLGRMGWVDRPAAAVIRDAAMSLYGFQLIENPSDERIRHMLLTSSATVYISSGEGYGLPPVESLWLGVPVIATPNIPSLEAVGSKGVHLLAEVGAEALHDAFRLFGDDEYSKAKQAEVASLNLTTWDGFVRETVSWVHGQV